MTPPSNIKTAYVVNLIIICLRFPQLKLLSKEAQITIIKENDNKTMYAQTITKMQEMKLHGSTLLPGHAQDNIGHS
jgi:hypothetical protein